VVALPPKTQDATKDAPACFYRAVSP
jgi:hypothetical protein